MNNFSVSPSSIPIYDQFYDKDNKKISERWKQWFLNVQNTLGAFEEHGNDSIILNSDFNWNRGIPGSTTQADGDGAEFSEKWYVFGASNATYTITPTAYSTNDTDQTGSAYYIDTVVTSHNGNPFYFYSRLDGDAFLRQFQSRTIAMSYKITNNQSKTIYLKMSVFVDFDGSTFENSGRIVSCDPGIQYMSSIIKTSSLSGITIGASPYIDFRLYFDDLVDGTADIKVHYIKSELSNYATPLYIDHAMEKVRIDANPP